jgi:uncharacterized protein YcbX
MSELIVSQLAIYPVKSMRQVSVENAVIDMGGLKNDRRWMVIDTEGRMITQRQQSRLCLIQPEILDGGLCLHASGMSDLKISNPDGDKTQRVAVWGDNCNACNAGVEAQRWLTEFMGIECSLVYFPGNEVRIVDQTFAREGDQTAFSDGFPVLLVSQASLDELNKRLDSPVPMARFRPNIVVSGGEPYAEDDWQQLKIGDFNLRIVKPCSRCVIPSIDIETAERTGEPTKTLSRYRRQDNKIIFGQNAVLDGHGVLKTGMSVELLI